MSSSQTGVILWEGAEVSQQLSGFLQEGQYSRLLVLCDSNTRQLCWPRLLRVCPELQGAELLEVAPGERSKSVLVLEDLWQRLTQLAADRHCLVINLGGGVVTDLGGFLAGTYLRGVDFVHLPTSLLGMVDAAHGGKCGINLSGYKNRVGLYLHPRAVGLWPDFLGSLPAREQRSGFAEMLKHGLIADAAHWRACTGWDISRQAPSADMIARSVAIKQEIVARDFRESGPRELLNFGHSLGHALESASYEAGDPLLHGEAVALGMQAEALLSVEFAGLSREAGQGVVGQLQAIFPDLHWPGTDLIRWLEADKKNRSGHWRFVLLDEIGRARQGVEVSREAVRTVTAALREQTKK